LHELFNDEFSNNDQAFSSLAQLNNKLKKNTAKSKDATAGGMYSNAFLFDDASTKPSISPPSAGDNSLKLNSSP
jgi:uncharacterized protein YigE (DUF2233 family)